MKPRIVQVGLGPLGIKVLEDAVNRGVVEIVGAVDVSPSVAGKPLATLLPGVAPDITVPDITVQGDLDDIDWTRVDVAVVTTSSALDKCADTFEELLANKVHIVSSCEELLFPWLRHPELASELDLAARRADRVLLGTGVNPGFVMDLLPLVTTGVCRDVRSIRIERIQDASTRRVPFQKKIGAGLDRAGFDAAVAAGTLRHVGLGESLHLVAHGLGWKIENWTETIEPVIATEALECKLGPIAPGVAAGVRQVAKGTVRDPNGQEREVLHLEFIAAIGQPEPRDAVLIRGEPDVDLVIRGGVHGDVATSALLLHCVFSAREAPSGLRTVADVRPPRWARGQQG
ncbi:MAG: dihydrodipicolinate reductase [Planctomycetota bacterium]